MHAPAKTQSRIGRTGVQAAALVAIACWAYSPIGIRIALHSYSPTQIALLRFAIASFMLACIAGTRGLARAQPRNMTLLSALALFGVAGHHIALNFGQGWVSAGASSSLAQTAPIFTVLLAGPVLGEVVRRRHWICVALGACGAILIVKGDKAISGSWMGGALILFAALSWGIYFTLLRRASRVMDATSTACYTVWVGTAMLIPFGLPGLGTALNHASPDASLAVILLGLFPSALAYLAWSHVLQHWEASRASLLLFAVPPTAMLMAIPALGETPGWFVILGTGLILCGVFLLPRRDPL